MRAGDIRLVGNGLRLARIFSVLIVVDVFFLYLATYGLYSIAGQIAYIFFLPAIPIANGLSAFFPPGTGALGPLFIIQFLLMGIITFAILGLRKRFRSR
jgi:hypothetical protein